MADVYRNHVFHGGRSGKEVLEIPARYGCREERKKKEAETEDIAMPFEDIGRDVNVVYPIEIGKKFKGFYILSNGAVAIDYELTDNGGFEDDDSIGKIDMNLN